MRSYRLQTHLVLIATAPMLVALLTTSMIVGYLGVAAIQRTKAEHLEVQAKLLAFNAAAAVSENDASAAQRHLASLRTQSEVLVGCLFDRKGEALARFSAFGEGGPQSVNLTTAGYRYLSIDRLEVVAPVIHRGQLEGYVYLLARMDDAKQEIRNYVLVLSAVLIVAVSLALWLASRLKRTIAVPVLQLADIARAVSLRHEFASRSLIEGPSEVRECAQCFNQMLDEISASRDALCEAAATLEGKVQERTQQLSDEIRLRESIEQDLRVSKEDADAANSAKSAFLANMSHEIRTPLNGILGFTRLLLQDTEESLGSAERSDYLETINRSGEQLLALINDILDLSKVEAGRLEIERAPCQPVEIIGDVLRLFQPRAREKGLRLVHEICSTVPPSLIMARTKQGLPPPNCGGIPQWIWSDPLRLRQVLTNLVSNAVKFTPCGSVTVLTQLVEKDDQPQLEIKVRDTGIGILPDKLQTVFEPFVQADTSITREFGGTGLGLAISRRIVAAMGGTLSVESTFGHGSTFTAALPTGPIGHAALVGNREHRGNMHREASATHLVRIDARVLVVDDGETNRKLAEAVLRRSGADVELAENGEQALRLAEERRFDVVLMDIQMPVMDGYAATRRLRELGHEMPIIAITAAAMSQDVERCLAAGCTDYLSKPFAPEELVAKLAVHLEAGKPAAPEASGSEPARAPAWTQPNDRIASELPMDDPVFRQIVRDFARSLDLRLSVLREAVGNRAWESIATEAHWLKGAAGTVGFSAFTVPASRLIELAKSRDVVGAQEKLAEIRALSETIEIPSEE